MEEYHQGRVKLKKGEVSPDGLWMEAERKKLQAYEWMEACMKTTLPRTEDLDEHLQNGIILAELAKVFCPELVKKIFRGEKLQFRHSDNINYFLDSLRQEGLPDVFLFELTDLYDRKNVPKVIYCIHAFSHLMAKKGKAPAIENLLGKLQFADEDLEKTVRGLEEADVQMPAFGNVGSALNNELASQHNLTEEEVEKQKREEEEKLRLQKEEEERIEQERIKELERLEKERLEQERLERERLLLENQENIAKVQALYRGKKARKEYEKQREIKSKESAWTKLQALWRAGKVRKQYLETKNHYQQHQDAITKIQALFRGRRVQRQYQALVKNAGMEPKHLQNFGILLDDGVSDFEQEISVEKLRREVIQKIRENLATEAEVNELDQKIALFVKNRVSLDEVIHFTSKKMRAQLAQASQKTADIITLKGADKDTRQKRRHYEELFYLLQTEPIYLSKLMFTMNKKNGAGVTRFLEQVVLTLFGYAQNEREEYLFLNLIDAAIGIELNDIAKLDEFWRDNPLFIRLVLQYIRGAKERQFLRDVLSEPLKQVLNNSTLEINTDPVAIYKAIIREEESRTGEKSTRPYDVTPAEALEDAQVKQGLSESVEKLKELTSTFLQAIINSLPKIPFGLRYISKKMAEHMKKKFPLEDDEILRIVGNLFYYRYLNPAIVAPEAFDVIDTAISPTQRKNLAEIAKVLNAISVNRSEHNEAQLTDFIHSSFKEFSIFLKSLGEVESAEDHFNMDTLIDMSRQKKPLIYITPDEVIQVHRNLVEHVDDLCKKEDPLAIILNELGVPPAADSGAKGPKSEIALQLTNRFAKIEDEVQATSRILLQETKRQITTIIRIQVEKNLLRLLEAPTTELHESIFADLAEKEAQKPSESPLSPELKYATSGVSFFYDTNVYTNPDGTTMTFSQYKKLALENMDKLEGLGLVSKNDQYQSMLNLIAEEALNKQRRRKQRVKEVASLTNTLATLKEKASYLEDQKKSYLDYIETCKANLSTKKKAKRPPLFSKQFYHLRDVQKSGKVPKFGTFKYSASDLYKKGVLISIEDYTPKQYGQISITISSDQAGVFEVSADFLGISMEKQELRLEDLLASQYSKVDVIELFDIAKVNLNLLVFLINKKFFV